MLVQNTRATFYIIKYFIIFYIKSFVYERAELNNIIICDKMI